MATIVELPRFKLSSSRLAAAENWYQSCLAALNLSNFSFGQEIAELPSCRLPYCIAGKQLQIMCLQLRKNLWFCLKFPCCILKLMISLFQFSLWHPPHLWFLCCNFSVAFSYLQYLSQVANKQSKQL